MTNIGTLREMILKSVMQSALNRAITLATELHKDQRDKGGSEYIGHPLRVMQTILAKGHDTEVAIAAVLHDTVEDTSLTIEDVQKQFGDRVAVIITLLSKLPGEDYEVFIDRIIASGNRDAMHVKLADLADNSDVSRLGHEPDEYERKRLIKYERASQKLLAALK